MSDNGGDGRFFIKIFANSTRKPLNWFRFAFHISRFSTPLYPFPFPISHFPFLIFALHREFSQQKMFGVLQAVYGIDGSTTTDTVQYKMSTHNLDNLLIYCSSRIIMGFERLPTSRNNTWSEKKHRKYANHMINCLIVDLNDLKLAKYWILDFIGWIACTLHKPQRFNPSIWSLWLNSNDDENNRYSIMKWWHLIPKVRCIQNS